MSILLFSNVRGIDRLVGVPSYVQSPKLPTLLQYIDYANARRSFDSVVFRVYKGNGEKSMVSVQGNDCWVGRSKPITSSLIHFSALIVVRSREFINADARRLGRGGRGVVGCNLAEFSGNEL